MGHLDANVTHIVHQMRGACCCCRHCSPAALWQASPSPHSSSGLCRLQFRLTAAACQTSPCGKPLMPPQQTPKGKRQRHCCSLPPHALSPPQLLLLQQQCTTPPGSLQPPLQHSSCCLCPIDSQHQHCSLHQPFILWRPLPPPQHKTSQCCNLHPGPTPHSCCCCGHNTSHRQGASCHLCNTAAI